jgi:hypothetical protein
VHKDKYHKLICYIFISSLKHINSSYRHPINALTKPPTYHIYLKDTKIITASNTIIAYSFSSFFNSCYYRVLIPLFFLSHLKPPKFSHSWLLFIISFLNICLVYTFSLNLNKNKKTQNLGNIKHQI